MKIESTWVMLKNHQLSHVRNTDRERILTLTSTYFLQQKLLCAFLSLQLNPAAPFCVASLLARVTVNIGRMRKETYSAKLEWGINSSTQLV